MNTRPPNEHSADNPNVFDGTTNTNAMRECEVTQTYLKDGLLNSSVVWADFEFFTLKFIKILMQLCKSFL